MRKSLNLFEAIETTSTRMRHGTRPAIAAASMLCLLVGFVTAGCSAKEKTTAATPPATGQAAPGDLAPGAKAPTPEQEAAKQHGMQQGPAIEAAMKRSQGK